MVAEGLVLDIAILRNCGANVVLERWRPFRKLGGNGGENFSRMANISATSREEEAGSEMTLLKVFAGDGTSDCGLPCASQAAEPIYPPLIFSSPCSYLLKDADSSIRKAGRVMLSLSRVESRVDRNR